MTPRLWLLLLTVEALAAAFPTRTVAACDTNAWRHSLQQYSQEHSRAEAADLYKLGHQGIMGSEHAVTDTSAASAWMRRELGTLSASKGTVAHKQMVEPLPPNGRFVRVNLRPFIAAGGDPAKLVGAFVATANASKGDTTEFACVERSLADTKRSDLMNRLVSLIRERRKTGFDAGHHSAAFEAAYAPAYRVVRAPLTDSLLARVRPAR